MHSEETTIFTVVLIAVGAVGIIMAYYVYSIVRTHRAEMERKRLFMFNEMKVLEGERERIAQDIHDTAGPELSLLKFDLDYIQAVTPADIETIRKLKVNIDSIIDNFRRISHNLMPRVLTQYGLLSAIADICEKMSGKDMKIEFKGEFNQPIPQDIAIHLYRIIEEIIFNTIKHAKATRLKIQVSGESSNIQIITRDNGIGFATPENLKSKSGLGLKGFEYRIELLGGKFSIYSEEGKGVEIKMAVPV